jgi:hypothetical protein
MDGEVSDYFEWLSAGQVHAAYGAAESAARPVRPLCFGTDGARLYLALDPVEPPARNRWPEPSWWCARRRRGAHPARAAPGAGRTEAGPLRWWWEDVEAAPLSPPADGPEARFQVEIDSGWRSQSGPHEGSLAVAWGEDPAPYD